MDLDYSKLNPSQSPFLKNTRFLLNNNANDSNNSGNGANIGSNVGKITNILSNEVAGTLTLPEGTNQTIGQYEFVDLNEGYWFVWNSLGNHTINRHDGNTGLLENVYTGSCLNFDIDPTNKIPEHCVHMVIRYKADSFEEGVTTVSDKIIFEKELIFTDGKNNVRQVNVLASIGSNSFTTPYYAPVFPHTGEKCDLITLAPIAPLYAPTFTLVERVEDGTNTGHAVDKNLTNKLFNHAIQTSYQFVYTDARPSSISMYSLPIIVGGTDCAEQNPETQPRCADITLWVGNAHVEKINIFTRETPDGNWTLYDTIKKFDCDDVNEYWERDINEQWSDYFYDSTSNTIKYRFCNDKQCTPVDQSIFTHIENEVPFASRALTPAGDALLLSNNLRDSDNLSCDLIDRFSAQVTVPDIEQCVLEKRKIVMYVLIKNATEDRDNNGHEPQFLWGNNSTGTNSSIDGKFYFGGFGKRNKPCDLTNNTKYAVDNFWKEYQQYVPEETGGFVGYLAGTNYQAISKQVKFRTDDCTEEEIGIIYRDITKMNNSNGSFDDIINDLVSSNYVFLQKFIFEDIPPGKYVFRVAGHRTGTTVGYEKTSTYIFGYDNLIGNCGGGGSDDFPYSSPAVKNEYEWTIDVCNDGYNSLEENGSVMILWDNTYPDFEADICNVIDYNIVRELYLYEDSGFTIPYEMQQLDFEYGSFKDKVTGDLIPIDNFSPPLFDPLTINSLFLPIPTGCPPPISGGVLAIPSGVMDHPLRKTDHNGFVFHIEHFWRWRTYFSGLLCSPIDMTAHFSEPTLGKLKISYRDECATEETEWFTVGKNQVSPPVTAISNKGYKGLNGTIQKSVGTSNKPCDRVLIKGRLIDEKGKPLTGITIGYENSQFVRTDGFGGFKVYAHYPLSGTRCDNFIISNSGAACQVVCIGCVSCCGIMYEETCLPTCVDCEDIIIDKGEIKLQKVNQPDKGLKGRYGFAVEGWDYYGRIVTGGVNIIDYLDVVNCWVNHPILSWNYIGGLLPKEIKWLTFSLTQNLNGSIIQWVADKFSLLDTEGNVTTNKGNAQAVAVDISSLINYNKNYNFNTLATYGFVKGDILKIIDDCTTPIQYLISGTTFGTTATTALQETTLTLSNSAGTSSTKTNFATDNGSTIIIPYDNQIDDFLDKCAIKIEIVRPYQCENNLNPFFEQWQSVPVIDGVPSVSSGDLNAFDTYKIYRNIGKLKDCTQNPNDDPYFSNNVTDFWGKLVTSGGRVLSENPFAERKWRENEIAKSNEWINNGVVNGLATFRNENVKNYKGQDWGGIVSVHAERNMLIVICTLDWFTAPYEYNYLKATQTGLIEATLSQNLGDPTQKVGKNYGCQLSHKATIIYQDGLVLWYDANNSNLVICTYGDAVDVADSGVKGWLMSKTKYVADYNIGKSLDEIFDIHAGFDPMHNEYHLTFRKRGSDFTNQHREVFINESETIVFNTKSKQWANFRGYIPESYSKLRNAKDGSQFISFVNGVAYLHNNLTGTRNTFYGEAQTSVIEISVAIDDSKEKVFQSISQECLPTNFFADRILTSEKNAISYVPQNYWQRKENTWYAEILRDMNSYFDANYMQNSTLIEGKRMFGKYALIRFVMAEDRQATYFELNKLWCLLFGSELSEKPQVASGNNS